MAKAVAATSCGALIGKDGKRVSKYQVHQLDANHKQIVAALEAGGYSVESIGRPVDIIAGKNGRSYLFEIKTPKGKVRESQRKFFARWRGHAAILRSVEDVQAFLRAGDR